MKPITVFYDGLVYGEYESMAGVHLHEMPDGIYIYYPQRPIYIWDKTKQWFLKDLTPVLLGDVPNQLRLLVLIMS